jgi:hypothetical protein
MRSQHRLVRLKCCKTKPIVWLESGVLRSAVFFLRNKKLISPFFAIEINFFIFGTLKIKKL